MMSMASWFSKYAGKASRHTKSLPKARRALHAELLEDRNLLATGLGLVPGLTDSQPALLITGYYYDLLNRAPSATEVSGWTAKLANGMTSLKAATYFTASTEFLADFVVNNYWKLLQRAPTAQEATTWVQNLGGSTTDSADATILSSAEYYQDQSKNDSTWVTSLYQNVLGRAPSTTELNQWLQTLKSGTSHYQVAYSIVDSTEANTQRVDWDFQMLLNRSPNPGEVNEFVPLLDYWITPSQLLDTIAASQEYASDQTLTPETPAIFGTGTNAGLHFEFTGENASLAPGYTRVPIVNFTSARGYGWLALYGTGWSDMNTAGPLTSNFEAGTADSFQVNFPNGSYTVKETLGDRYQPHTGMSLSLNGTTVATGVQTAINQFVTGSYNVNVTGGSLTLKIAASGADPTFALDTLDIIPNTGSGSLTVSPGSLPNGVASSPYSVTLAASGGSGSYTYAVTAGSLPGWLTLNSSSGLLSGTPSASGTSSFTVTATDNKNASLKGSTPYTLVVSSGSLTVSPGSLPNGVPSSPYGVTLAASGGSGSYTYAVTAGSLPGWLTLNSSSGLLSGTPSASGTSSFTVTATDSKNASLKGSMSYTLVVSSGSLAVSPGSLPNGVPSVPYSVTLAASGGSGSYTYAVTAGSLPGWLTLNSSSGVLSGTPPTSGTSSFTVTATDSKNASLKGSMSYTLVVNAVVTTPQLTIPDFGANPTIVNKTSGNWSNAAIWSLGRLPKTGDIVDIQPGTTVTYDVNDTVDTLNTVEILAGGTLQFATNVNTQITVGNFVVLQGGALVVGTQAAPIAANVGCNIVIANQPINTAIDPQQLGTGLIALGNVTMFGAVKTPYATLALEPHAGDKTLTLAQPVTGWQTGDQVVIPDTRQLNDTEYLSNYVSQIEQMNVSSVSANGLVVTLTAPLKYNHLGARNDKGVLKYLAQVMNTDRNIMIESANQTGIRGYTLFTNRANVNVQNTGFCELGRTINAAIDNTTFGSNGQVNHIGTNEDDRYAMTIYDLIGPSTIPANGYQFTFIGNEVDNDGDGKSNNFNVQWGLALDNSFYGLIRQNVVFDVAGVGIGVGDPASSYNVFDRNFVVNVSGTGGRLDATNQGDGFWFGNPNNTVTNNIASDINAGGGVYSYGFNVDASNHYATDGDQLVPAAQGDDPSLPGQSIVLNMNATPLLSFSGNELYGATPNGFIVWWLGIEFNVPQGNASSGVLANSVVWNQYAWAYWTYENSNLTINGFTVLGDANQVATQKYNMAEGLNLTDYVTRNLIVENVDIEDEAIGVEAPVNVGISEPPSTFTIENSYLDNVTNIQIGLLKFADGGQNLCGRTIIIENIRFAQPASIVDGLTPSNIYMDDVEANGSQAYNLVQPTVVHVINYNGISGDNFQTFFNYNAPTGAGQMAGVIGLVVPE
jgi:hypothetical protein